MDDADFGGFTAHAFDEAHQVPLIGVGGVAADGVHACLDIDPLSIEQDITAPWPSGPYCWMFRPGVPRAW